ncbi:MAG: MBL fold metallo-hydrolase [Thermodesulfobacteriota bacterium]
MRLTPVASGSSGNSYLVEAESAKLLIDAGLTAKQIVLRLGQVGVDPGDLHAIVVSHAHSDHVKGVGVLSRKFKIPVWMNEGTRSVIGDSLGKIDTWEAFETGKSFQVAGFKIHPFAVPHDCKDPVGFRITREAAGIGIATDMGTPTGLAATLLTGLEVVVVESNHDPVMLQEGPYPWELKQRIRGRLGHLSNPDSARLLQRIVSDRLRFVVLGHLSEKNNRQELALDCAREALHGFLNTGGRLYCASQDEVGPSIEI